MVLLSISHDYKNHTGKCLQIMVSCTKNEMSVTIIITTKDKYTSEILSHLSLQLSLHGGNSLVVVSLCLFEPGGVSQYILSVYFLILFMELIQVWPSGDEKVVSLWIQCLKWMSHKQFSWTQGAPWEGSLLNNLKELSSRLHE